MKSKNKTVWICLAAGLMLAVPLCRTMFAQKVDVFHAQIQGGGDHGKCTIEVNVDGVAEIEIRGDEGRMRTLSGAASTWRRMECTEPLPQNPLDFHFTGVDGRGSQKLLHDPASNRGTAVVRIEDPKGGREGYTFDIEWRGGGLVAPGSGPGRPQWDDEIRFTGRGDGYFKNFRDPDEVLRDCQISIDRSGVVNVTFQNARRARLTFTGQVTRFEQGLIVADMSGAGVRGSMEILRIGPDRITDISMSPEGRERFELNWHR